MSSKKHADETVGALSLEKVRPALEALDVEKIVQPNMSLQAMGLAALVLVDRATKTELAARMAAVSSEMWDKKTIEKLGDTANAALQIDIESAREEVAETGVKVDAALIEEGTTVKERMLVTLEYNFGRKRSVALEISAIRAGTGYMDLVNDLLRCAQLYAERKKDLAADKINYDPADAARANDLAARIRAEFLAAASQASVYAPLRPRVSTELTRLYEEVRAAAAFAFRSEPAKLEGFEPLRAAAKAVSSKRPKKSDPVVVVTPPTGTPIATPPATTAPANAAPAAGAATMSAGH